MAYITCSPKKHNSIGPENERWYWVRSLLQSQEKGKESQTKQKYFIENTALMANMLSILSTSSQNNSQNRIFECEGFLF
jgi:hypothetical protein